MAAAIGVVQVTVSNWEQGLIGISWKNARKAEAVAKKHGHKGFSAQCFMDDSLSEAGREAA